MSPSRETMCLIDDKANHIPADKQLFDGLASQHLWSDIKQVGSPVGHLFNGISSFYRVKQAIDGHRLADATSRQVIHLVFHQ